MATLTVKLTTTGGLNTALSPANAQHNDGVVSTIIEPSNLLLDRTQGDHTGADLGIINTVLAVAEFSQINSASWKFTPIFNSTPLGTQTLSAPGTYSLDVTASRVWSWSDFASSLLAMQATIHLGGTGVSQARIDYLWFEIDYTPVTYVVVDEAVESHEEKDFVSIVVADEEADIGEEINQVIFLMVSEDENINEDIVIFYPAMVFVVIDEDVNIKEIFVTSKTIFDAPNDNRPLAEKLRDVARARREGLFHGTSPWPVKQVPLRDAAHINMKTITHMDDMFRAIYRRLKELKDGSD